MRLGLGEVSDVPIEHRDHDELSHDDLHLLALLASGLPSPAVARTLNTSSRTLRRRIRCICDQIGVQTLVEAIAWAARRRLI